MNKRQRVGSGPIQVLWQKWQAISPIQKGAFRLIGRFLLVFIVMNILLTPLFMHFARDYNMRLIHKDALVAHQFISSGAALNAQQKQAFVTHQNLRGIIVSQNANALADDAQIFWFSENNQDLSNLYISNLDQDGLIENLRQIAHLVLTPNNKNAIVTKYNPALKAYVSAIYAQETTINVIHYSNRISTIFIALFSFGLALMMQRIFHREVSNYMTDLLVSLYGKKLKIDKKSLSSDGPGSIDHLQARLNDHIDEQARLASLGAGAVRLAHDIRNALASLQLFADKLSYSENESDKAMGSRMNISIERAVSLCDWATRYSSSRKKTINFARQPLQSLVDEVLTLVRLHDVGHNVELKNKIKAGEYMDCERNLAFRIIYNIVLNAIQAISASGKKGVVSVNSQIEKGGITLIIEDTGPGMSAETVENLFTPYQGSLKPGGTGLGMAIANELARWHEGRLELRQTGAQGSTFTLYMPNVKADNTVSTAATETIEVA